MTAPKSFLSVEEYLETEEQSEVKREYINGTVFVMFGASDEHVTITGNVVALLKGHLRSGPYLVYASDMKVHVEVAKAFFYFASVEFHCPIDLVYEDVLFAEEAHDTLT